MQSNHSVASDERLNALQKQIHTLPVVRIEWHMCYSSLRQSAHVSLPLINRYKANMARNLRDLTGTETGTNNVDPSTNSVCERL